MVSTHTLVYFFSPSLLFMSSSGCTAALWGKHLYTVTIRKTLRHSYIVRKSFTQSSPHAQMHDTRRFQVHSHVAQHLPLAHSWYPPQAEVNYSWNPLCTWKTTMQVHNARLQQHRPFWTTLKIQQQWPPTEGCLLARGFVHMNTWRDRFRRKKMVAHLSGHLSEVSLCYFSVAQTEYRQNELLHKSIQKAHVIAKS